MQTPVGSKPIQDLRAGDLVLSRDEGTEEMRSRTVVPPFVRHGVEVIDVVIRSGDATETLHTTAEHPFWVPGRGWVKAADLKAGDALFSPQGRSLRVEKVTPTGRAATVHNLEVEGFHTYFVGNLRAWVHNNCASATVHGVSPDWAVRGTHATVRGIEIMLRPGNGGEIVIKKVFSTTADVAFRSAARATRELLSNNTVFRQQLLRNVRHAKEYFKGQGHDAQFHFLEKLLTRNVL